MDKLHYGLIGIVALLLLGFIGITGTPQEPSSVTKTVTRTETTTIIQPPEVQIRTITLEKTITTTTTATTLLGDASWEVYFSPKGGAADRIVYWLDRSNSSICAMIYSFTNDDISAAFIRAYQRGVEVKVSMDNQQLNVQGGEYRTLVDSGVPVRVDMRSGLLHNKVAVIDGKIVITGSYNWSVAAENTNRENLIIMQDPTLALLYQENCEKTWNVSAQ